MDTILPRGPQCDDTQYHQDMNYAHTVMTRKSNEKTISEDRPDYIHKRKPTPRIVQEEIKSDQIYVNVKSGSTEEQLGLSQEIYTLKINIHQLIKDKEELKDQIHLLKDQNSELSSKLTNQAISDLKSYEEEKRQWKLDREGLENTISLCKGYIRCQDEDKLHQGEKISMLEIALKAHHSSPEYAYNPRDAMYSSHSNTIQQYRGHTSDIPTYGKPGSSPAYHSAYSHSHHTTVPLVYDPNLTCDHCGSKFLYDEIQKLREHLNTMHPN
ncbi:hypothetical protein LOD99_11678 [Oopsacas minuta]|uniref:C2H2-type domain-containing protein n=1 Tax=Oopsacas minuta TaxID=111878 RepID=A0AAV7JKR6_9METZ|nr:hypothetical protein LOD99_11678 [Oopsacas minuta]